MGKTREIKGRMKAVDNIQRITKTMQMIATAKCQACKGSFSIKRPSSMVTTDFVDNRLSASPRGKARSV